MNTWRIDVQLGEENYVKQGHLDPVTELMNPTSMDSRFGTDTKLAEVEIQALVSGPFSNSRVISTVRLNCVQNEDALERAQEIATTKAMEGLQDGWAALQTRIERGHFPGCAR